MMRALLAVLLLWLAASPAFAQDLASLIADRINVDPSGKVTATGNVEVFYAGTRLTAQSITYSQDGDRLTIEGPGADPAGEPETEWIGDFPSEDGGDGPGQGADGPPA